MRTMLLLASGLWLIWAAGVAQAAKPTITVIIPGWSPGDGRQIWPDGMRRIGEQAGQTISGGGSNHKTIYYKWPSHGNNKQAVADLAKQIHAEAAALGTEVDLNIVGHSRGGVLACDVLDKIGDDERFGYAQGVLLDPTAANSAGDQFPTTKPVGVDRLVNYYDGKHGIKIGGGLNSDSKNWRNTDSDRDIAGAENHEVDLDGNDTHVSIVDSYLNSDLQVTDPGTGQTKSTGAAADTRDFYYDKEGLPKSNRDPQGSGGANQDIVLQTPKSDQERLTGPIEKGLNDTFEQVGRTGSDVQREGRNVVEGRLGSKDSPKHWEGMVDEGWVHGRDLAFGGGEQTSRNLQAVGNHAAEMLGRGGRRLNENVGDFLADPANTIKKGTARSGRELERLGKHHAGQAADLGEHWQNMGAQGTQHAARMRDKYGEKADQWVGDAGRKLAAGRDRSRRVFAAAEERAGNKLSQAHSQALNDAADAEQRTGQRLTKARDRVYAEVARKADRAAQNVVRARDRVFAQGANMEQRSGQALSQARDRASDQLAAGETKVGSTASRTRQRVLASANDVEQAAGQAWNDTREGLSQTLGPVQLQATGAWENGGEQLGRSWNEARQWLPQQPARPNPLADFGRALGQAVQQEQARRVQEQAQRMQQQAQQQALQAQQEMQRQAAAAQRQAEQRAREAAMARDRARRQAEEAQRWAQEQARRRADEVRQAAQRAAADAQRELGNAGRQLEQAGSGIISGGRKVLGF